MTRSEERAGVRLLAGRSCCGGRARAGHTSSKCLPRALGGDRGENEVEVLDGRENLFDSDAGARDRQAAQNPDASRIATTRAVDTSDRMWKPVVGATSQSNPALATEALANNAASFRSVRYLQQISIAPLGIQFNPVRGTPATVAPQKPSHSGCTRSS